MSNRRDPETGLCRRGTSNRNDRGSAEQRRRRKQWLLRTYASNRPGIKITYADEPMPHLPTICIGTTDIFFPSFGSFDVAWGNWVRTALVHEYVVRVEEVPTCLCYRCGEILTIETVTVDRIVPGCVKTKMFPRGGTYVRWNIRPACSGCNSETGGPLSKNKKPVEREPRVFELIAGSTALAG